VATSLYVTETVRPYSFEARSRAGRTPSRGPSRRSLHRETRISCSPLALSLALRFGRSATFLEVERSAGRAPAREHRGDVRVVQRRRALEHDCADALLQVEGFAGGVELRPDPLPAPSAWRWTPWASGPRAPRNFVWRTAAAGGSAGRHRSHAGW
jgi:hypothetical protein